MDKDKCNILGGKNVDVNRIVNGKSEVFTECSWKKDQCMTWPIPEKGQKIYYKCDSCEIINGERLCQNCKITDTPCNPENDDKCDKQELFKPYSEWNYDTNRCEIANDAMRRACDSVKGMRYIKDFTVQELIDKGIVNNRVQANNALKRQLCVLQDRDYCKSKGGNWNWNGNLGINDCTIPDAQKVFEWVFGTTITRGVKVGAEELAKATEKGYLETKKWTKGAIKDTEKFFTDGGGNDAINWTKNAGVNIGDFIKDDVGNFVVKDVGNFVTEDIGGFIKDDVGNFVTEDVGGFFTDIFS